jgi:hypothetical protein
MATSTPEKALGQPTDGPEEEVAMRRVTVALLIAVLWARPIGARFVQFGEKVVGAGAVGAALQGTTLGLSADADVAIVGGPDHNSGVGAAWVFTRDSGAWTYNNKLVGTGAVGPASQGASVALSADGFTAIVGGRDDNGGVGAAWVFTHEGLTFHQEGNKLVGTGAVGAACQGAAVALSANGNTAIVGGPCDNGSVGAAWVFVHGAGGWSQQAKLVGTGAAGSAQQGIAVALSSDGSTALVGGWGDNGFAGAAWVFTRSGTTWTQQGSKLVGTGATGSAHQGWSVALSADGNTALVGGWGDDASRGATWVFTRSAGVWTQQGSKLVGSGAVGNSLQGASVALTGDGNTAAVGGYGDDANTGAVWIFKRSAGVWSQQGDKLVGAGAVGAAEQGRSVRLSADGRFVVVGGWRDDADAGAMWAFTTALWVQQGPKLYGYYSTGAGGQQGSSVAVCADGATAISGGPLDDSEMGAAWVFVRSGGAWALEGEKLVGTGAVGSRVYQGSSVALSADGNSAIVGGYGDNTYVGAAWVFTRSAGVWTQQGGKLVGTGGTGSPMQGSSVALSADGNTAIVAGPGDNSNAGATWVFTRSAGVWTQQGSKLVGTGATGSAHQGGHVALSADGNTAIVGGASDYSNTGAAWVFVRSGGVWAQQGSKLVGTGGAGTPMQGQSVALSDDGNTALFGGYRDSSYTGAAWVFTRSAGVWTQQGSKLVGTEAIGTANQGVSVALSGDGDTAFVGGYLDNTNIGAVWVFHRSAGVWTQQGSKVVGTGVGVIGTAGSRQGTSLALSGDGATAVVGAQSDNNWDGAAWVFVPLCARGLANTTIATTQVFISCGTLTAGPAFRVESPGDVTFRAVVSVILANGFSVGSGGTFTAGLDPSLAP